MFRSVGYRPVGLRGRGSRLQHRGAADRSELGDALGGPDRLVDVVGRANRRSTRRPVAVPIAWAAAWSATPPRTASG